MKNRIVRLLGRCGNFCSSPQGKKFSQLCFAVVVGAVGGYMIVQHFGLNLSVSTLVLQNAFTWTKKLVKLALESSTEIAGKIWVKALLPTWMTGQKASSSELTTLTESESPAKPEPASTLEKGEKQATPARSVIMTLLGWLILTIICTAMQ